MAITSVTYRPNHLSPAYNPIVWSCLSSEAAELNMKYVFDIYIDDTVTKVLRIKQRPNPAGYGMIDVSHIVQSYIDWSKAEAPITNGETTIDYSSGHVFSDNRYLSRSVLVKVGEEVNGITYTGNGTVGEPAYLLYSGNTSTSTVRAWQASLDSRNEKWHMQDTAASGIFGGSSLFANTGAQRNFDFGLGLAYPLSFDSLVREVYPFDKCVLTFLNYSPTLSTTFNRIYGFRIVVKSAAGTTVHTDDLAIYTATGNTQRVNDYDVTASQDARYDLVHVLASPNDLITALGETTVLTDGMEIWITGHKQVSAASTTFGAAVTETVKLKVKEYCIPALYPRVRLSWLNELGGRDYLNFTALSEKTISTETQMFHNDRLDWSGSVPVVENSGDYPVGRLVTSGGLKPYSKKVTTTFDIESDWLTQEQVNMLESLQKSSQILAYVHDENNPLSDEFAYSVTVKDASYSTRNVRQAKLVQGKFTVEVTLSQKIQSTI
jgi:hypothetical protein